MKTIFGFAMLGSLCLSATIVQPKPKVDEAEVQAVTKMFRKIADPENSHFADFQRDFGKVIDQLRPGANHDKDERRLDRLTNDIEQSLTEYKEHHPKPSQTNNPPKEASTTGKQNSNC